MYPPASLVLVLVSKPRTPGVVPLPNMPKKPAKKSDRNQLWIAVISAAAVVIAAVIAGLFSLASQTSGSGSGSNSTSATTAAPQPGVGLSTEAMTQTDLGNHVRLTFRGTSTAKGFPIHIFGEFSTAKIPTRIARVSPAAEQADGGHWSVDWLIEGLPIDPIFYAFMWNKPSPVSGGTTPHEAAPSTPSTPQPTRTRPPPTCPTSASCPSPSPTRPSSTTISPSPTRVPSSTSTTPTTTARPALDPKKLAEGFKSGNVDPSLVKSYAPVPPPG